MSPRSAKNSGSDMKRSARHYQVIADIIGPESTKNLAVNAPQAFNLQERNLSTKMSSNLPPKGSKKHLRFSGHDRRAQAGTRASVNSSQVFKRGGNPNY